MADIFWFNSPFGSWSFELSEIFGGITGFATKKRPDHKFTYVFYIASGMISAELNGSLERVIGIGLQPTLHIGNGWVGNPTIVLSTCAAESGRILEAEVAIDTISLFIFCRDDWPK